jgi:RNA polymerase sigma factor (sigma-70 family)
MAELCSRETDEALAVRFQDGDEEAFNELYQRYHRRVQAAILSRLRLCRSIHLADDLTQECWMKLLRGIGRFDPARMPWRAWMFGHARYTVLAWWGHSRAQRRDRRCVISLDGPPVGSSLERPLAEQLSPKRPPYFCFFKNSPFDYAAAQETRRYVCRAISTLSPRVRTFVEARLVSGLNVHEIARLIGWNSASAGEAFNAAMTDLETAMESPHRAPLPTGRSREDAGVVVV